MHEEELPVGGSRQSVRAYREARAFFSLIVGDGDPWAKQEAHPADEWTIRKMSLGTGSFT